MLLALLVASGLGYAGTARGWASEANIPPASSAVPAAASEASAPRSDRPSPGTLQSAEELVRKPVFSVAGLVETGNRALSLAGVAPTPLDLQCGAGTDLWPCGRVARTALQSFVRGRSLQCRSPEDAVPDKSKARCAVAGGDVGEWLVSQGWAAADGPTYAEAAETARREKRGIWSPNRTGPFGVVAASQPALAADAVLRAEVELSTQSMTVTYRGAVIGEWPVSTAREGKETPTGVWTAQWLSRDHRSRLYNDAPMPYSIFFEGDYAIHGTYQTARLGQPASHGCVRLSPKNARLLFNLAAKEGVANMVVVIRP